VTAVIDKDLASEQLAREIGADTLLILTSVRGVALNYRMPQERFLERVTAQEARRYLTEGHFAPGSMQPKIEAAIQFVESGPGRKTIVAELSQAVEALEGEAGTWIMGS
jgi:carbamate kinase